MVLDAILIIVVLTLSYCWLRPGELRQIRFLIVDEQELVLIPTQVKGEWIPARGRAGAGAQDKGGVFIGNKGHCPLTYPLKSRLITGELLSKAVMPLGPLIS